MKSKIYWSVFIGVSVLVALSLLFASGVLKNKDSFSENEKTVISAVGENIHKKERKNEQQTDNDSVKKDDVDLATSDVDFESDPEDTANDISDVKGFDDDENFNSIDSEVY